MSTEQRDQQQPQAPAPQPEAAAGRRDFAKKSVYAAITGTFSGTARALWRHVLDADV